MVAILFVRDYGCHPGWVIESTETVEPACHALAGIALVVGITGGAFWERRAGRKRWSQFADTNPMEEQICRKHPRKQSRQDTFQ